VQNTRDNTAVVRVLAFPAADNVALTQFPSNPIVVPAVPMSSISLARLSSTRGVLVYRNPSDSGKV
jgi:hypothetical protein